MNSLNYFDLNQILFPNLTEGNESYYLNTSNSLLTNYPLNNNFFQLNFPNNPLYEAQVFNSQNKDNILTMHNINAYNNINKINNDYNNAKNEKIIILEKNTILNANKKNEEKEKNNIKIKKYKVKPENIIDISLIMAGKEKRTFVRLHPIPKYFSVYDMVKIIDKYLKTKPGQRIYNAVYLPLTKKIGRNMGYLFINLISPKYVIEFYNKFNGFYLRFKNCKKPLTVIFADNQEVDISEEDPIRRPLFFIDTIENEKKENIKKKGDI